LPETSVAGKSGKGRSIALISILIFAGIVAYTIYSLQLQLPKDLIDSAKDFFRENVTQSKVPGDKVDNTDLVLGRTPDVGLESMGLADSVETAFLPGSSNRAPLGEAGPQAEDDSSIIISAKLDSVPVPVPVPTPVSMDAVLIDFSFDSSELSPFSQDVLDKTVKPLKHFQSHAISIKGYSDRNGADSYNLALSHRRAAAVADYLVERGVDADRLRVEGRGIDYDLADNKNIGVATQDDEWRVVQIELSQQGL